MTNRKATRSTKSLDIVENIHALELIVFSGSLTSTSPIYLNCMFIMLQYNNVRYNQEIPNE